MAGVDVDIEDIARVKAALARPPGLAERLFTAAERSEVGERHAGADSLSGCFAAKEALAEVLGAPAGLRWTDAKLLRNGDGRPFLAVRGTAADAAPARGIGAWRVSLSDDGGFRVAVAGECTAECGQA